jgi:HPt (histidine-containing phosphotransfer) domain-containing protein/PAS domain-containing protein
MQLTWRFVVLIAALLGAVAATTLAGLASMENLDGALKGVVDNDMPRLLAITHSRRLFRSMVVLERDFILAKEAAERKTLSTKVGTLATELTDQLGRYAKLAPDDDRQLLTDIGGARDRFIALSERVRQTALQDPEAALSLAKQHAKDPVSWEKVIGELVKRSEQRLDKQVGETHQLYVKARSTLIGVSLVAALVGAGLGFVIFRGIRRMVSEVLHLNTHLESLVKARTESLSQRERALRLVLDSTGDGLIEVGRDGKLTGASSAAAARWFGELRPDQKLSDCLFPDDPEQAGLFSMAFDQLAEDIMPWELSHDQMPNRVQRDDRILELDFRRVLEDGAFNKILVVARDVTESVHSEAFEQSTREQHELVTRLLQDKQGFAQFVKDAEELLSALATETDLTVSKRHLHTLKGNISIFGLTSMAELCHQVEDRIAESNALPTGKDVADLTALWRTRLSSIESFLTAMSETRLEIEKSEHDKLILSLIDRKDSVEIVNMVEVWSWPRTSERLVRLRAHAEFLGKRLEKSLDVTILHNELRAPRDYLEKFWPSLIHVLRNAVDHGAQTESERLALGKSKATHIELSTERTDASFVICIQDDGRGVDRAALLAAGRRVNPGIADDAALEELLFMDGVSSRSEVTQTSGRGVGLSAVRQACQAEGGRVEVTTTLAARLERRWSLLPESNTPPANTQHLAASNRSRSG